MQALVMHYACRAGARQVLGLAGALGYAGGPYARCSLGGRALG
jgi:hypothetical protein